MKLISQRPVVALVLIICVVSLVIASAQGQTSTWGNIMTYDQRNQWILFTDQTGTWHAPMAMRNAAAPSGSVTEFTVNTDGQFEVQQFNNGVVSALLNLDTDGHVVLAGTQGGGIATDVTTGETCIPATMTGLPCGPQATRWSNGDANHAQGVLSAYRGQPLAGNGQPTILYYADSQLTGSFGPYTIFTTNASGYASSGMYRLSGYLTATSTQPGGSMQFILGYTDEVRGQIQMNGFPIPFAAPGANLPFSFVFFSQPEKPITISTVTTGGPTYTIHLRLEAL